MKENKINSKKIRLGKITYFDEKNNGSLIPPIDAYVLMVNINGVYVNPFDVSMDLPIYDRVPYTNTTLDGESYGTKIKLIQGDVVTGPCVVLDKLDFSKYTGIDSFSINMLKDYILKSNKFFVDRIPLFEKNVKKKNLFWTFDNRFLSIKEKYSGDRLSEDVKSLSNLNDFLDECDKEYKTHYTR